MSFSRLIKGITPKIRMFCLVLINSVILSLLSVFGSSSVVVCVQNEFSDLTSRDSIYEKKTELLELEIELL